MWDVFYHGGVVDSNVPEGNIINPTWHAKTLIPIPAQLSV